MMKKVALTGIKPTGIPHIGNYLGAIQPAIELTKDHDSLYFIADYHALTTVRDRDVLNNQIHIIAATWLASGLDPESVTFYRQSHIPEVFELTWILSCFSPKGLLNRAHSYKDAVENNTQAGNDPDDGVNCGLYNYPILMAADILMFSSDVVPVGQDQKQHLEITRDIAQAFNQAYGDILTLPEPLIQDAVKTVPGVDGRKMSKSYGNEIPLYAPPKELKKRINQVVTDSKSVEEPKDPEECNLFAIYSLFASAEDIESTKQQYLQGGIGYGDMKKRIFDLIDTFVADSRDKYETLMKDTSEIDRILDQGAQKARAIAKSLLKEIRRAIGIE